MSSVDSSPPALIAVAVAGFWLGADGDDAWGDDGSRAGVPAAGLGAASAARSASCPSNGGVVPGSERGGGGTAPGGRNVAVLVAPSSSPIVERAARGPRGSPMLEAGLLLPIVPKLEGASVSRGASLPRVVGKGGGGNAVAGNGAVVAAAVTFAVDAATGLVVGNGAVATGAVVTGAVVTGAVGAGPGASGAEGARSAATGAAAIGAVVLGAAVRAAAGAEPVAAGGEPATSVVAGLRWLRTGGGGGPDDLRGWACAGGAELACAGGATDVPAGRRTGGGGGFEV
jgi:hypothetical protein